MEYYLAKGISREDHEIGHKLQRRFEIILTERQNDVLGTPLHSPPHGYG